MSTIIEHSVRGEVMQMKGTTNQDEQLIQYLQKNFYKTASLMVNSCKSAAILGGYNDSIVTAAYRYRNHIGVAFQLVDDILDFTGSASIMGKPALSDLHAGISTAPVLFAAEMFPEEIGPLMDRKFTGEVGVERAVEFVGRSDGIVRTRYWLGFMWSWRLMLFWSWIRVFIGSRLFIWGTRFWGGPCD